MKTVRSVIIVMVMSLPFIGSVNCTDIVLTDQERTNREIIDSIINLSPRIHTEGLPQDEKCKLLAKRMSVYKKYYVQPETNPNTRAIFTANYLDDAVGMEKLCQNDKQKDRYDFTDEALLGGMQAFLLEKYEDQVILQRKISQKGSSSYEMVRYRKALTAFPISQPEALELFNWLKTVNE